MTPGCLCSHAIDVAEIVIKEIIDDDNVDELIVAMTDMIKESVDLTNVVSSILENA